MLIAQPERVIPEMADEATVAAARKRQAAALHLVPLDSYAEGRSVSSCTMVPTTTRGRHCSACMRSTCRPADCRPEVVTTRSTCRILAAAIRPR